MKKYILIILSLSIFMHLNGQTVNGTILDAKTNKAIPFATVYYDQSISGTSADQNGNFQISVSKDNQIPLIVSAIGYYSFTFLEYSENENMIVHLQPKIYELSETVISTDERKRYLYLFKREFIGTTENAQECEILNISDITVNHDSDTVKVYASKPILIENRALGYKITYYLDKFEYYESASNCVGTSVFTEIETEDKKIIENFNKNRRAAYYGSRMHFIRVLHSNLLDDSKFRVYIEMEKFLKTSDFVLENDKEQKFLKNIGDLNIHYYNRCSFIFCLQDSIYFDEKGFFDQGMIWGGDMAVDRIGDLLPYEYFPADCPYLGKPLSKNTQPRGFMKSVLNPIHGNK